MDPATEKTLEGNLILGKRKRSLDEHAIAIAGEKRDHILQTFRREQKDASEDTAEAKRTKVVLPPTQVSNDVESDSNGPIARLPCSLLQRIFCSLDPFDLGRLLRVNRIFRALLDPREALPEIIQDKEAPLIPQDTIWTSSRRSLLPGTPRPIGSLSEHAMFRLTHGRRCQYCGRLPSGQSLSVAISPWNSGPGPHGVRAIWPFRIKSCADCLRQRLVKESELMLSSSSIVQPGLPFACFTPSLNYVTSVTLRQSSVPAGLQLTKYYFRPHIEDLQQHAQAARLLGPGAYENWYRGLESQLQESTADTTRLENWETSTRPAPNTDYIPLDSSSMSSVSVPSGVHQVSATPSVASNAMRSSWNRSEKFQTQSQMHAGSMPVAPLYMPLQPYELAPGQQPSTSTSGSGPLSKDSACVPEVTRIDPHQTVQSGAGKRVEFGRRYRQFMPYTDPSEPEQSKASQYTARSQPFFEHHSWDRRRSKTDIDMRHANSLANSAAESEVASSHLTSRGTIIIPEAPLETNSIATVLAQAQRPTREKLQDIAQDFVRGCWMNGTSLTETTAPQFAADVLQYVRRRFYEIQAQEDQIILSKGHEPLGDSASGARVRRLKLEHMKYVFETCVKPYTELARKELYLCSACELQDKYFVFDAIIQHYAAKHTSAFSRGTAVVSWKADWPEEPPFHPQPGGVTVPQMADSWPPPFNHTVSVSGNPMSTRVPLSNPRKYPESSVLESWKPQTEYRHDQATAWVKTATTQAERPASTDEQRVSRLPAAAATASGYHDLQPPTEQRYPGSGGYTQRSASRPRTDLKEISRILRDRLSSSSRGAHPDNTDVNARAEQYDRSRMLPGLSHDVNDAYTRSPGRPLSMPPGEHDYAKMSGKNDVGQENYAPESTTAERFLHDFDPLAPEIATGRFGSKVPSLSETYQQNQGPQSGFAMDRRSNVSQPRKPTHTGPIDEVGGLAPHDSTRIDLAEDRNTTSTGRDGDTRMSESTERETRGLRLQPMREPYYRRHPQVLESRDDSYDDRYYPETYRNLPPSRYVDQYGRPIDPPSPEPPYYRHHDDYDHLRPREDLRYAGGYSYAYGDPAPPRERVWDPQTARYYYVVERSMREYIPAPAPTHEPYEQPLSSRGPIYEQGGRYYEEIPARTYRPDHDYERH